MEDILHSESFYSQEFVAARQAGYLPSSSPAISIFVRSSVQQAAELSLQWPVHEPPDIDNWLRRTKAPNISLSRRRSERDEPRDVPVLRVQRLPQRR